MRWFRLYSEIKDDPKMLELDDHQFRLWVNLLAMASESELRGTIPGYRPRGIAAALRVDEATLAGALLLFEELQMIEYDETSREITILNWNDRQYDKPSDAPEATRDRKRRSRQRHADVTRGHATDTDTDTDTEPEESEETSEVADAPRTPPYEPEHFELAVQLDQRIQEHNPKAKPASRRQLESWANDARLMVERDEHSVDEIRSVIEWCQESEFWRSNILSMGKLREQFPRLWAQMHERPTATRSPPRNQPDFSGTRNFRRKIAELEQRRA